MLSEACVSHFVPVWLPGPMFLLSGSLSLVPCSFQVVSGQGVSLSGGLCSGGLSRGGLCPGFLCLWEDPRNQKSGRYASCWNAFLF